MHSGLYFIPSLRQPEAACHFLPSCRAYQPAIQAFPSSSRRPDIISRLCPNSGHLKPLYPIALQARRPVVGYARAAYEAACCTGASRGPRPARVNLLSKEACLCRLRLQPKQHSERRVRIAHIDGICSDSTTSFSPRSLAATRRYGATSCNEGACSESRKPAAAN